jgi:pimeloyl-ACP methyl ester carboxylesterase
MTATVVLVHGAWHGAWCWERVAENLRAYGVDTIAIDLPGHGADTRALGDLHDDAAHVATVLGSIDGPAVLVGHSYGGAVVTEAGVRPNVAHLVYVAAFALTDEESCSTAGTSDPAAVAMIDHSGRSDVGALMIVDDEGVVALDREGVAQVFFNDCDDWWTQWAVDRLDRQRLESLMQSPDAVAWRERPSTYVLCTHDNAVHPDLQRLMAARCSEQLELPASHSPFLSWPDRLADHLHELAGRY